MACCPCAVCQSEHTVSNKFTKRISRECFWQKQIDKKSPKQTNKAAVLTTLLFSRQKYYGRKSSVGRDVCRLRKAYYSARHEAAVQIDEIVGETASEADSSDSLERDHGHHHHGGGGGPGSHDKDDDVIRCICGMYKDEGLMIQCEKCMVRSKVPNINNKKKASEKCIFVSLADRLHLF